MGETKPETPADNGGSRLSDTEKRLKPYASAAFVITMACSAAALVVLVLFLVLFLRQIPIGALVLTVAFLAILTAILWKPFQWWLKLTHVGEIYKDGRWQPMPRRGQRK